MKTGDAQNWESATPDELIALRPAFQRSARQRGVLPSVVFVKRYNGRVALSAMRYHEPGMWDRWGIQQHPPGDIKASWSTIRSWLRVLIGNRAVIEAFPTDEDIVNSAPIRWFWVLPGELFQQCNFAKLSARKEGTEET